MDVIISCLICLGLINSPSEFDINNYNEKQLKKIEHLYHRLEMWQVKKKKFDDRIRQQIISAIDELAG